MSTQRNRNFTCTAFLAVTIDGHIARKNGDIDFLPPPPSRDIGEVAETNEKPSVPTHQDMLEASDLLVMGRKTYEAVCRLCRAGALPSESTQGSSSWPYGTIPLLVLTTHEKAILPECPDHTVKIEIANDLNEVISFAHKAQCTHIWVDGGRTVRSFLAEGLIDDLILTTVGVLLGSRDGGPAGLSLWEDLRLRKDICWKVEACEETNGMVGVHWKSSRT
jgi:dihydrofolate reductase